MDAKNLLKNRHKFKSFSKRISEITLNLTYDFELKKEHPRKGENGSFFDDHLRDSIKTCLDPQYARFVSKIIKLTPTLSLLLFNKEKIVEAICEFLELGYDDARSGIDDVMRLIAMLARDLRSEFYPYFPRIFTLLIRLFQPKDPNFVEAFFKCIAFLIDFLKRSLAEDLDNVIHLFVTELFDNEKDFTRRLAAEALAFFLRQLQNKKSAFRKLFKQAQSYTDETKDIPLNLKENEKLPTYRERIVETTFLTIYNVAKNVNGTVRTYATEIVDWCYTDTYEITNDVFILLNRKLANHITPGNQHEILPMLMELLPKINHSLACHIMAIWTNTHNGKLIDNPTEAFRILKTCSVDSDIEPLVQYIKSLENVHIDAKNNKIISDAIIRCVLENVQIEEEFEGCMQIARAARTGVLEYFADNVNEAKRMLPVIRWANTSSGELPEKLPSTLLAALKKNREDIIPIMEFLHTREIYDAIAALKNKSLAERDVMYQLMAVYEPTKLAEQAPILFNDVKNNLQNAETLRLLERLLIASSEADAEWINTSSPIYHQLFEIVNFNTPDQEVQKLAAKILMMFLGDATPIEGLKDYDLMIRVCDIVFNAKHDAQSYRNGEVAINRLIHELPQLHDTDKLLNIAFGFARQPYINFRHNASILIGHIIKFRPEQYGPVVSEQIKMQFESPDSPLYPPSLISGVTEGEYVDDVLVDLLVKFASIKLNMGEDEDDADLTEEEDQNEKEVSSAKQEAAKSKLLAQLITAVTAVKGNEQFYEKVDKATSLLLRSTKLEIRKAAFDVQFHYHIDANRQINEQIRTRIRNQLEAFVDPRKNIDTVMRLNEFAEQLEFERDFLTRTAVALTIGVYFEFIGEKIRQKHKYTQIATAMMQPISFLRTDEIAPLFEAAFPQDNDRAALRAAPKFLGPLISRLAKHLGPFVPKISQILIDSMRACEGAQPKTMKAAAKACTLFIESVPDLDEFVLEVLKSCEVNSKISVDTTLRFLIAASERYPQLFAERTQLLERIIEKMPVQANNNAELISIMGLIAPYVSDLQQAIIESAQKLVDEYILLKRPTIILSMLDLLTALKPNNSPELHDLLISFLIKSREINAIPILSGIEYSMPEFKRLSSLIGRPLDPEFRAQLVPLIAESLGEFAEAFVIINGEDLAAKTVSYRDLDSVGEFSFVFAMQAFADMQIDDFSLQNAATGFITRIIATKSDLVQEFILPTLEFHIRKRRMRIPVSEAVILFQSFAQHMPDLLPTMTRVCAIDSFKFIGSSEECARGKALEELGAAIEEATDWDEEEFSRYLLPLLCQLSTTPGVVTALAPVCQRSSRAAIDNLLHRLVQKVDRSASVSLLLALCQAKAFTAEQVTSTLLHVIEDKKTSNRAQLQLITALLSINASPNVITRLISYVISKMQNKKPEIREVGLEAVSALAENMPTNMLFELFQTLRSQLREGYMIPLFYASMFNVVEKAPEQGAFDSFIGVLTDTLLNDIFGAHAQLRASMHKTVPEAKKCYTFGTIENLAKKIIFNKAVNEMIEAVLNQFTQLKTNPQNSAAKKIIEHITNGLSENETVQADLLVNIVKDLLKRGREEDQKQKKETEVKSAIPVYGQAYHDDLLLEKPHRGSAELGEELVRNIGKDFLPSLFAVKLLAIFFDKELFDTDDEDQRNILDELLNDLWYFTKSSMDKDSLTVALSILEHYASLCIFPSFEKLLGEIIGFLTRELPKMGTATDPFGKRVFSLLTVMLRNYQSLELPTTFTRALVQFSMGQLDIHESCEAIFGVLILVIEKRRDIPEMYDCADRSFELIVRGGSAEVRKFAAKFCSKYITLYKMKKVVFEARLKEVVANLKSTKSAGRRSVLKFLHYFIEDADEHQLDTYAELIFLHLGMRIANETDDGVIKKLNKVIAELLRTVSNARFSKLWELMIRFAEAGGAKTRVGMLTIAIAVRENPAALEPTIPALQQITDERMESDNKKVRLAAVVLHKALVASFPDSESVKLLGIEQLMSMIGDRDTAKAGCELAFWYLSEYEAFAPSEEELVKFANILLECVIAWSGYISEAAESLHLILIRLEAVDLNGFATTAVERLSSIDSNSIHLAVMRVFVGTISALGADCPPEFMRVGMRYIGRHKDGKERELRKSAEKAIEVLRQSIDADVFGENWAAVVAEDEEAKKARQEKTAEERENDPEALRERRRRERQEKKIEKRRKQYLEDDASKGTIHPFGPDGRRVESLPLPPEFQN